MAELTLGLEGTTAWPAEFAERYRNAGYWVDQTFGEALREWAQRSGEATAVVCGERRWSYRELDQRVDRLAAGLQQLGIQPKQRVVVQLPNCAEWFVVCFALFRVGAIPLMALPAHRLAEIGYFCQHSEAVAYVIADKIGSFDYRNLAAEVKAVAPTLEHVLVVGEAGSFTALADVDAEPSEFPTLDPAEVALFQLSGGSTGVPKLIARTHDDYLYSVRASAEICELDASSVYLCVLPMAHNFPMSSPGTLGTLVAGGTVVLAPQPSPDVAFPLIAREGVTITGMVPPLALLWLDAAANRKAELSSLKQILVGGAPFGADTARRVHPELGCQLQQVYGMAEGLVNYTRLDDPTELICHTQGRPISPLDEVRIVDDEDNDLPLGELGHLITRGPYTIRGYYRAAEHNQRAFTSDGFYRTGDLARLNAAGYVSVEGRAKDQINRGGEKVAAEEIEQHLLNHPAIHDVALVGLPDRFLGERTCAVIVSNGVTINRREVVQFLRSRGLAEYKLPDRVEIVESLPKTGVGKINKRLLREQLSAGRVPA
ncbi:MAG: (2,3-dihydroxybenzoyl)adenylate synthase [Chloroflexi bacterium]|nr:(2,3-dihydroxybenzoyl)adenylate synthase [Chloroflexota bacterium]